MNKVILSGNLTRDPEIRYTQNGKAIAKMGIAVNRRFSRDTVDFFNLTAWDKTAEFCSRYLKKGSSVIVEGRVENDNYEGKDGVKHYSVNIQIENIEFGSSSRRQGGSSESEPEPEADPPFDDNVPF